MVREFTPAVIVTISPATATQVAFASTPLSLIAGIQGGPITVQLEDAEGHPVAATVAQTIQLSTTSLAGAFYDSAGNATTSITVPAGQSDVTFYYADTQAGTPTLTASDIALNSSSSQQETIDPAAAVRFVVTTCFSSPDVAGTTGTVTVTAKDPYGNIAGSGPDQYLGTVDLS